MSEILESSSFLSTLRDHKHDYELNGSSNEQKISPPASHPATNTQKLSLVTWTSQDTLRLRWHLCHCASEASKQTLTRKSSSFRDQPPKLIGPPGTRTDSIGYYEVNNPL